MSPSFRKTLSYPVFRLMSNDIPIVKPQDPATKVRRLFREFRSRIAVVVDRERFLGVIYRSSLMHLLSVKSEALALNIMEDPPFTLDVNTKVREAVETMLKYDEWYGVVVDQHSYRGILGLEHVISSLLEENPSILESERVGDHMTSNMVVTAHPSDFISKIWRKMAEYRYAGLPVVDDKGRLVGIITQYDIISKGYSRPEIASEGGLARGARVSEAMTYSVSYLYPWSTLREAAEMMVSRGFGRIPIVNSEHERRLIGIIDREDIVKFALGGGF